MDEQKHTAWRVAPPVAYAGTEINIDCGESGLDGFICTVGHRGDQRAEDNAHLIVRAVNTYPAVADLVEALETAAARFKCMRRVGVVNGADPVVGYQEIEATLNRFRSLEAGKVGAQ